MSIFEPIPRDSGWDEDDPDLDGARWDDGTAPAAAQLDPRSILIAGVVVIAIVIMGLVVSNMAQPDSRPERLVPSRVDPGAAAVEQVEAKQSAPDPSASPSVESDEEDGGDAQVDAGADDTHASGGFKWDGKPGKGHGRGHG
jgi:hypothetical protein